MTTGLVNTDGLLQIIATNARRRRFERQRMKYRRPTDDDDFRNGGGDPCLKNSRGRATREGTSSEDTSSTRKKSKIDDGKMISDLTLSASSSSSETSSNKEGNPVRMLVSGGEFSGETDSRSVTCLSHGSISVIGRRRAMEDTLMVAPGILAGDLTSYDFFAVYDGHGGVSVAQACRDRLHQLLANEVEGYDHEGGGGRGIDWEKVMVSCFKQMDDEVNVGGGGGVEAPGVSTVGSTAVVVMVGREELVVANCGDSRAVLCRGGIAVPLSRDHKPDRPDERERVEALGGKIIDWNGCRVLGVLATSRSIGDQYLKPYVISEPEVTVSVRTESDNFLIIATDGLWDVLSNEAACEVVRRCLVGLVRRRFIDDQMNGSYSMEAAAMLAELAMARGSKDNISVIVVELKKSPGSVS